MCLSLVNWVLCFLTVCQLGLCLHLSASRVWLLQLSLLRDQDQVKQTYAFITAFTRVTESNSTCSWWSAPWSRTSPLWSSLMLSYQIRLKKTASRWQLPLTFSREQAIRSQNCCCCPLKFKLDSSKPNDSKRSAGVCVTKINPPLYEIFYQIINILWDYIFCFSIPAFCPAYFGRSLFQHAWFRWSARHEDLQITTQLFGSGVLEQGNV